MKPSRIVGGTAAVILTAAVLLGGCDSGEKVQRQTLSIVVREGLEAEGLRQVAEEWAKKRNVDARVDALGRGDYETVTKNVLASSSPQYDVVFFPGTQVAEMAAKHALAPIDNWNPADDPDLLAYSGYNGNVFALPCDVSTFFTFYRSDVVSKLPETWSELLKLGPTWSASAGAQTSTKYGYAFAGQAGEELPKIFYPILWSYGGYVLQDGKVGIDSREALEAATIFKQLATSKAAPAEIQTWNVLKILDELKAGTVALSTPQWNALYPLLKGTTSDIGRKIAIGPIPGAMRSDGTLFRVNFRHTWVLVKPARGKRLSLANDFILYATGRDGARLYAKTARGNPARQSILSDPELQKTRPEFPLMLQAIKQSRAEPEVPYYSELHEIMNQALSRILSGSSTPKEALGEAAKQIRALVSGTSVRRN